MPAMTRKESLQLLCHIALVQICHNVLDKAGVMSRTVTAIIAAEGNSTIDKNASDACNVVIKEFACYKTARDRVTDSFGMLLYDHYNSYYGDQALSIC